MHYLTTFCLFLYAAVTVHSFPRIEKRDLPDVGKQCAYTDLTQNGVSIRSFCNVQKNTNSVISKAQTITDMSRKQTAVEAVCPFGFTEIVSVHLFSSFVKYVTASNPSHDLRSKIDVNLRH